MEKMLSPAFWRGVLSGIALSFAALCQPLGAAIPLVDGTDWGAMLGGHDMLWASLPQSWDEAPFLGNGEQGTLMYQLGPRTLRWDVGSSAVHDHRPVADDNLSERAPEVLNRGRLFIGHLRLELPVALTGSTTRLKLWDAEAVGTLTSAGGSANWTTLVHATEPVMRFELTATGTLSGANFVYVPEEARSPRELQQNLPRSPANPSAVLSQLSDGVNLAVHTLSAGGQTAVAWLERENGGTKRLWLSVQHSFPGATAAAQATAAVRAAAGADQATWVAAHRAWWHNYYPASLVSTGDPYWDAFYWIQQYKRACATRDQGWIIDNQGPWLQPTGWNATWWNLNVQLSHSGVNAANRREMGTALSHKLDVLRDNLALNVPEAYRSDSYGIGRSSSGWDLLGHAGVPGGRSPMPSDIGSECGNLLWALHNVDMEYRYSADTGLRDHMLYPILTRAVNYYRHFLTEGADNRLHLPSTQSPEYANVEDCSFDLSLLRWGVGRLLELASEKGLDQTSEPLISAWIDIQNRLVLLHTSANGIMIGKNKELTSSHRHWSHLISIYPLRTLTPETQADRDLIETSLDHWHSFSGALQGYSFTAGACIAAGLGDGERALNLLNGLKTYIRPNTMYKESGPVMETPLHGATAMQEMLLQSWGGKLRVFPAVPAAWSDVQFHHLRGEGDFLVSARREQSATKWVLVEAGAGGSVKIVPQLVGAQWIKSAGASVTTAASGVYQFVAGPGDWVLIWPAGQAQPDVRVSPVTPRGAVYRFGLPPAPPTVFQGGNLLDGANWSTGTPTGSTTGMINTDGTKSGNDVTGWGAFSLESGTITVTGVPASSGDWSFQSSQFTMNGGTLNVSDDIFANRATYIFNDGTVTWGDDFKPNGDGTASIIINGGTFTGGAAAGNVFGNFEVGTMTINGGTITSHDFTFTAGTSSIRGGATLSGTTATFGALDIASDWTGSFTVSGFNATKWEAAFTSGAITYGGVTLDLAGFKLSFAVSTDGLRLTPATVGMSEKCRLKSVGFDGLGDFMMVAEGLNSSSNYELTRSIDLFAFGSLMPAVFIDGSLGTEQQVKDANPPAGKAFYRIESQ